jgi:hypothetical protein
VIKLSSAKLLPLEATNLGDLILIFNAAADGI